MKQMPNTIVETKREMQSEFMDAREYLQQGEENLYSHLLTILHHALHENTADLYENLETISANIKKQKLKVETLKLSTIPPSTAEIALNASILAAIELSYQLVRDANSTKIEHQKEFLGFRLPDLVAQSHLFAAVGLSFTEEDAVIFQLSLASLAKQHKLSTLSFWGTIYGNKQNYIIVEAPVSKEEAKIAFESFPKTVKKKSEIKGISRTELSGRGANAYRYYVTNSLTGEWALLPDATPELISKARDIQSYFEGDLNRVLYNIPNFPITEGQYLRAQIARISAAAHLSPKGALTVEEDEEIGDRVMADEAWEGVDISSAKELENWVHTKKKILKNGRCEQFVAPELEENEDEEESEETEETAEEEEDPEDVIPLLSSLDADEFPSYSSFHPYRIKTCQLNSTHPHAVFSAWSNTWPGAVSIAHHTESFNVYFGFGQKYLPSYYTPPPIMAMAKEWCPPAEDDEDEDVNRCEEQSDPQPPEEEEEEQEEEQEEDENEEDED